MTGDRAELADFLRTRREALQPEDVGLPRGPRRRTGGLRREEVAALCGMSADYYSRIEQQRGPHPSEQMLAAHRPRPAALPRRARPPVPARPATPSPRRALRADHINPGLMRILDRLGGHPRAGHDRARRDAACRPGPRWRCSATRPATRVWRAASPTAGSPTRRSRAIYPAEDHAVHGRVFTADLRARVRPRRHRLPRGRDRRRAAGRSPEFAGLVGRARGRPQHRKTKRIQHPQVGLLELHCQTLSTPTRASPCWCSPPRRAARARRSCAS